MKRIGGFERQKLWMRTPLEEEAKEVSNGDDGFANAYRIKGRLYQEGFVEVTVVPIFNGF